MFSSYFILALSTRLVLCGNFPPFFLKAVTDDHSVIFTRTFSEPKSWQLSIVHVTETLWLAHVASSLLASFKSMTQGSSLTPCWRWWDLFSVRFRRYNYRVLELQCVKSIFRSHIPARTAKVCKYMTELHIVDVGKLHSQQLVFTLLFLETFSTLVNFTL